jgi:hypothetical protein
VDPGAGIFPLAADAREKRETRRNRATPKSGQMSATMLKEMLMPPAVALIAGIKVLAHVAEASSTHPGRGHSFELAGHELHGLEHHSGRWCHGHSPPTAPSTARRGATAAITA